MDGLWGSIPEELISELKNLWKEGASHIMIWVQNVSGRGEVSENTRKWEWAQGVWETKRSFWLELCEQREKWPKMSLVQICMASGHDEEHMSPWRRVELQSLTTALELSRRWYQKNWSCQRQIEGVGRLAISIHIESGNRLAQASWCFRRAAKSSSLPSPKGY